MEIKELPRMTPEEENKAMEVYSTHKSKIKKLEECLALARELNVVNQIPLYEAEIKASTKRWKIDHQNPYPEVTREDAMDAMCEPLIVCEKHEKAACAMCRIRDARMVKDYKFKLWADAVVIAAPNNGLTPHQGQALGNALLAAQQINWQQQGAALGQQQQYTDTHTATFPMWGIANQLGNIQRISPTVYPAMLPLPALIRLKEAKEREIFDSYEVWRPVTKEEYAQLTDPWLVGIVYDDGKMRCFKLCDWR